MSMSAYWILFIGVMILSYIVQATLQSRYNKYSRIPLDGGLTGRDVAERMLRENGIEFRMTDAAIDFIAQAGFDPQFGARPIKRALQRLVLNELSKRIIAGEVDRSKPIEVDVVNDQLQFTN